MLELLKENTDSGSVVRALLVQLLRVVLGFQSFYSLLDGRSPHKLLKEQFDTRVCLSSITGNRHQETKLRPSGLFLLAVGFETSAVSNNRSVYYVLRNSKSISKIFVVQIFLHSTLNLVLSDTFLPSRT